jgi:hypothetical protein
MNDSPPVFPNTTSYTASKHMSYSDIVRSRTRMCTRAQVDSEREE